MGETGVVEISTGASQMRWRSSEKRLLVMSDSAGHCDQFATVLRDAQYEVVMANSIEELLDLAELSVPNVVVLSNDRSNNVVRLVNQVAVRAPGAAVMVRFERPDEAELLAVVHAGAIGYLPVKIPPPRLRVAIEAVLKGEPVIPRSMAGAVLRQLRSPGSITLRIRGDQVIKVTAREWDAAGRHQLRRDRRLSQGQERWSTTSRGQRPGGNVGRVQQRPALRLTTPGRARGDSPSRARYTSGIKSSNARSRFRLLSLWYKVTK